MPWGQVWRTGADEATTITFSEDVKIEGESLPAGTYALFTVTGEQSWTIVFNKVAQQWGSFNYSQAEDALRVNVNSKPMDREESLNFEVYATWIILRWENLGVPFEVKRAG